MARFSRSSASVAAALAVLSACGGGAFTAGDGQGGNAGGAATGGAVASLGGGGAVSAGGASAGAGTSQGGVGTGGNAQGGRPSNSGGSPAAGTPGAGGFNGFGGSAPGTGGNASGNCDSLWQNYTKEQQAARTCSPDGASKQCSSDFVLPDVCGCEVPVNGTSEHYTKARELYTQWKRSCPAAACLIGCTVNEAPPTCKSTSAGQSMCSW
ncbi:MAG TPA: hypothetical protein VFQ35_27330 [Polyangiaceae bacterium]|nr:hypothetical protein [Polyangiaceae bacterium]